MTAEISFPFRYADSGILFDIYDYYCESLTIDTDDLEEIHFVDYVEYMNIIENELYNLEDCDIRNGIVYLKSYDCGDEETMSGIEDFLIRNKIPYDSIDGGERYLYSYRPEQQNRVFRRMTHMDVQGPVYSLEKLVNTLDELDVLGISDPKTLKATLLKNLGRYERETPVNLEVLATDNNFNNFNSNGLLGINDLHYNV